MIAFAVVCATVAAVLGMFFCVQSWIGRAIRTRAADIARARIAAYAHDLRQPIQAIELYASALERRLESEEGKVILTRLHACVADSQARLAQIVDLPASHN